MGWGNLFFIRLLEQRPALFRTALRIDGDGPAAPACDLNGGPRSCRSDHASADGEGVLALGEHGVKARSHADEHAGRRGTTTCTLRYLNA